MIIQLDQIRSKQGYKHVVNHVRTNNLVSIHFDHQKIIMIWVQNQNFRIKTH